MDKMIESVILKIGKLIEKPKMTEKLLSKPPFRFLHDTITAIINQSSSTTSFGKGLYSKNESDSSMVTEKQSKIDYLDKIISLVGICKGQVVNISPLKVIAGLEQENTVGFLLALVDCATDPNIDNDEAVKRCLRKDKPGTQQPPFRNKISAQAESKDDDPLENMETKAEEKVVGRVPEQLKYSAAERGVSRSGTRNGQLNTTSSSADLGLTELTRSSTQSIDSYIEKCDGSYAVTQSLLGELITRPKLTEKLLERPPFRFLHDIITEVIKVTGFANGLYSADELDSAKITEKQQKINFLDKAIKLVGTQLNTLIEAKAMKIVAGLEPQVTNRFLQLLAVAAKHSSKSKDSVQIVLGGNDLSTLSKADPKTQVITKPEKKLAQEEKPVVTAEAQSKAHMSTPGIEVKRLARPSTAGRRPPRAKTNTMIAAGQPTTGNDSKPQGIILDGKHEDDEVDVSDPLEESRLAETVKKNTCMIRSDGDDSAAQSKLVQDILTRQAEHANSNQMDAKNVEDKESGIRLSRAPVQAATSGYIGSESDITRLRNAIQTLVQHTVPLGGAMEFIQDDVEVMLTEERKWENETRRYEALYNDAKEKSKEVLQPLEAELRSIEERIQDKIAEIATVKGLIIRNQHKLMDIYKSRAIIS